MESTIYKSEKLFAESIGSQLSEILATRRIPVQEFAISCNVQYNQMTGYLRGEHAPNWDILIRMCNYLHIHIDELMPVVEEYRPRLASDDYELNYVLDLSFQKRITMKQTKKQANTEQITEVHEAEVQQPTLNELAQTFARRIVKVHQFLTEQQTPHEYNMSRSALTTGTSIGSLLLRTDYPQSRDDYFQWISRALDQARECQYWLSLLHDTGYLTDEQSESVQDDLKHILNILCAIIKSRKKTS